jgi:hypothetical protein
MKLAPKWTPKNQWFCSCEKPKTSRQAMKLGHSEYKSCAECRKLILKRSTRRNQEKAQ